MSKEKALARLPLALQRRAEMQAQAQQQLVEAILAARAAGATFREIGAALGMSHVAVQNMLKT